MMERGKLSRACWTAVVVVVLWESRRYLVGRRNRGAFLLLGFRIGIDRDLLIFLVSSTVEGHCVLVKECEVYAKEVEVPMDQPSRQIETCVSSLITKTI